ncbi:hypothetical protein FHS21_004942 [Phyllobacterium trifolii]|uniref:Uncharacterized protein n=1 Tax=Phyllobacterium trifolii TaxID=300193 RepID=A0A839UF82_9HYPH|nr:hypothetical protein [Phyllobacterium trifolii]MBB3148494.1 hypothetical protein [Phyllobacterium trifolii]
MRNQIFHIVERYRCSNAIAPEMIDQLKAPDCMQPGGERQVRFICRPPRMQRHQRLLHKIVCVAFMCIWKALPKIKTKMLCDVIQKNGIATCIAIQACEHQLFQVRFDGLHSVHLLIRGKSERVTFEMQMNQWAKA